MLVLVINGLAFQLETLLDDVALPSYHAALAVGPTSQRGEGLHRGRELGLRLDLGATRGPNCH
jgi:hypothetical protein